MVLLTLAEAAVLLVSAPVNLSVATSTAVYNACVTQAPPPGPAAQNTSQPPSTVKNTKANTLSVKDQEKLERRRHDEMVYEEEREIQILRSLIGEYGSPSQPNEHPLRILCLDGGGVRGLSSLLILKRIMQQVAPDVRNPRPCDYFDMISGTSTGGIIAIMLGRLQMSIDECIRAYKEMAKEVFGIDNVERLIRLGATKARFDAEVLERVIKRYAGNRWMINYYPNACKVFVVAVQTNNTDGGPKLFRTWGQKATNEGTRIWEAARATSAAPTFFKPITLNGVGYSDGGLGYNNPATLTYLEVVQTWGKNFPIKCFISIGTGASAAAKIRDKEGLGTYVVDLIEFLKDTATNTRRAHYEVKELLQFTNNYYRFETGNDLGSKVGMDRHDLMGTVESETEGYLNSFEVRGRLQKLAMEMKAAARESVPRYLRPKTESQ